MLRNSIAIIAYLSEVKENLPNMWNIDMTEL